jgi:hypothetical protein
MAEHNETVEKVARALYPLFAGIVTGRYPPRDYDATLEDNREAARELARAAIAALPELAALVAERDRYKAENVRLTIDLAEAQVALEPFADEANTYDSDDDDLRGGPLISDAMFLRIEEGDGTLTTSIITVGDLRRARAALAQGGEKP